MQLSEDDIQAVGQEIVNTFLDLFKKYEYNTSFEFYTAAHKTFKGIKHIIKRCLNGNDSITLVFHDGFPNITMFNTDAYDLTMDEIA